MSVTITKRLFYVTLSQFDKKICDKNAIVDFTESIQKTWHISPKVSTMYNGVAYYCLSIIFTIPPHKYILFYARP